jgi:hypothetical protein
MSPQKHDKMGLVSSNRWSKLVGSEPRAIGDQFFRLLLAKQERKLARRGE